MEIPFKRYFSKTAKAEAKAKGKGKSKKGRGREVEEEKESINDLIVLGKYEEAETRLEEKIRRNAKDLRAKLKLADLHMAAGQKSKAVEEYHAVAEGYAREGFHDKAIALLTKLTRLMPAEENTRVKIERLRRAKRLEHRRETVSDALLQRPEGAVGGGGTAAFGVRQLWEHLVNCHLVEDLDETQLGHLFQNFELQHLESGTDVARAGQRRDEFFVVGSGGVEALLELPNGTTTVIRLVEPGGTFGERALLQHKPWPATYRSSGPTTLLKLTRAGLEAALMGNENPRALLDALRSKRLDDEVAAAVEKAGAA